MGARILILTCAGFLLLCAVGFLLLPSRPPPASAPDVREAAQRAVRPSASPVAPSSPATTATPESAPAPVPDAPLEEIPTAASDPAPDADGVLRVPPPRWVARTRAELGRLLDLCLASEGLDVPRPIRIHVRLGFDPTQPDGPLHREVSVSDPGPWLRACASDALLDAAIPDPGAPADFEHTAEFTWEAGR